MNSGRRISQFLILIGFLSLFFIPLAYSGNRLLVKFKDNLDFQVKFNISHQSKVIKKFRKKYMILDSFETPKSLLNNPNIDYIEEDIILQKVQDFNDPMYPDQWHYFSQWGINLPDALLEINTPTLSIVAVLDTGIVNHSDLKSNTLSGADLISDIAMANDGNTRDMDASDPGDWISNIDSCSGGFYTAPSSWHGTHVSGTIGALSDNGIGVSGVNPYAKILPVRVLGKCGGYMSDIADGIRWAAGLNVSGLSTNKNPASVINLSLGGRGKCPQYMQAAINDAKSKGATIVVAAGNDGLNIDYTEFTPANCNGVITVGATTYYGSRANYSNYGNKVDIFAPGGGSSNGVLSTSNNGTTLPENESYKFLSGTSMAAPHVSGVISLLLTQKPDLKSEQILNIIKKTAQELSCSSCSQGLIDAYAAIIALNDEDVVGNTPITQPPSINDGGAISSPTRGSACGSVDMKENPLNQFFTIIISLLLLDFVIKRRKRITQISYQ